MPKPKAEKDKKKWAHPKGNVLHDKRMRTLVQRVKVGPTTDKLLHGQTRCEGITLKEGKRCGGWAVRGTIFCAHHGGSAKYQSGTGRDHAKAKKPVYRESNLYLKTLNKQEQETFDSIIDKLAIKPELSMLRTKLNSMLERYGDDWIPTRKQMEFMTRVIERLSLVAERIQRTVEGYKIRVIVDRQAMEDLFNVCKEFVPQSKWDELAAALVATADAASGRTASAAQA